MRRFARIAVLVWMIVAVAGWIVLLALGRLRGGRGDVLLLLVAAGPGILAYRWGRGAVSRSGTRFVRPVAKPRPPPREWEN